MIDYIILLAIAVFVLLPFFKFFKWWRRWSLLRSVTSTRRGTPSERELILSLLKMGYKAPTIFHDLYVEKRNGKYSQIDAVVITKVGIVVIEVKDYSGMIFGSGNQNYWTQVLAGGREKHRFYNPILQNSGHINALKSRVRSMANIPFHSVVIFYGNCELQDIDHIPADTYIGYAEDLKQIMKGIKKKNPTVKYGNTQKLFDVLRESVANGKSRKIVRQHIEDVKAYSR